VLTPQIFKANDIRGIVGTQWDLKGAQALGQAYGQLLNSPKIVLGRDMRLTSPEIRQAFIDGVTSVGVCVVDVGLASTDELWFASGRLDLPGVQITSSHNPSSYNGLKFCLPGAKPVTSGFLASLAESARAIDAGRAVACSADTGVVEHHDILPEYVSYLLTLVDCCNCRPLKVVVDAGNGMAGLTAPAVLERINVEVIGLYIDLDGHFPNHAPNPLEPQNLRDAQEAVRANNADLAFVFDGDADRVFVIDEQGQVVAPSAITAMIAVDELAKEPGGVIVVNTITSSAVTQIVEEHGGRVVQSKVGHTYMKALMASHNAIFGGEHSAHYYFRDFFGADTGMLAALHVLAVLGRADRPLSAVVRNFTRFVGSGEINSEVGDQAAAMSMVAEAFGGEAEVVWDDGVKIIGDDWWISLRPSNTEPLLRLNVEARDTDQMAALRDGVLGLISQA